MNKSLLHTAIASLYALHDDGNLTAEDKTVVQTQIQRLTYMGGTTNEPKKPKTENVEKEDVAEKPKSEKKSDDEGKKSIKTLINELQSGDGNILKSPYNKLVATGKVSYLVGTPLSTMVDSELLAQAVETGVDKDTMSTVIELSETKANVVDSITISEKLQAQVDKYIGAVEDGDKLYKVMTANGITKETLQDFGQVVKTLLGK